jgi:hypothetical protein
MHRRHRLTEVVIEPDKPIANVEHERVVENVEKGNPLHLRLLGRREVAGFVETAFRFR